MEAQVLPAGPPPTMMASYVGMAFISAHKKRIYFCPNSFLFNALWLARAAAKRNLPAW
jgi:hypothetical protein